MTQEKPGKVAIVTGGASGVGAASARLLAARGYHVLVNYQRSADMAQAVVAECAALGVQAMPVQGNVALDTDCLSVVQQAVSRWGRLDVLVNSAGATKFVPISNLDGVQAADFQFSCSDGHRRQRGRDEPRHCSARLAHPAGA